MVAPLWVVALAWMGGLLFGVASLYAWLKTRPRKDLYCICGRLVASYREI